jgi:hypothetical protein
VVDKRTLKNIALAIGGGLTTLVTTLLALSEDAEMPSASSGVCGLSESENEAIRAMVNTFLVQQNASCAFNLTIGSIMRSRINRCPSDVERGCGMDTSRHRECDPGLVRCYPGRVMNLGVFL